MYFASLAPELSAPDIVRASLTYKSHLRVIPDHFHFGWSIMWEFQPSKIKRFWFNLSHFLFSFVCAFDNTFMQFIFLQFWNVQSSGANDRCRMTQRLASETDLLGGVRSCKVKRGQFYFLKSRNSIILEARWKKWQFESNELHLFSKSGPNWTVQWSSMDRPL